MTNEERKQNPQEPVPSFIESTSKKLVLLSLPDEKRDEINQERQKMARLMIGCIWVIGDGRVRIEVAIPLADQNEEEIGRFRLPRPTPNQPKNDRFLTFTVETSLPRGRKTVKNRNESRRVPLIGTFQGRSLEELLQTTAWKEPTFENIPSY